MKSLTRLLIVAFTSGALSSALFAGPEPLARDMSKGKETAAVATPECNWSGFYIGINAGGQFGHSEDKDLDDWNEPDRPWGYSESGFTGGLQLGYNLQLHWLLLGVEGDVGYMSVEGSGTEPDPRFHDTVGSSDGDFFTTFRGRVGFALNSWLFYATGGGLGLNYTTRVIDSTSSNGSNTISARNTDFDWGYTVGGGVEKMLGCHWSIKLEYLYFAVDRETFSGVSNFGDKFGWSADTAGHIVRAGLNFKF